MSRPGNPEKGTKTYANNAPGYYDRRQDDQDWHNEC
jgi:hypothetical protein